jgi:hypothetical protein
LSARKITGRPKAPDQRVAGRLAAAHQRADLEAAGVEEQLEAAPRGELPALRHQALDARRPAHPAPDRAPALQLLQDRLPVAHEGCEGNMRAR